MKPTQVDDPWAEPEPVTRRPFFMAIGFGVALLVLGTGTAAIANASATPKPDVVAIESYCTLEQQGAHKLAEDLRRRERELEGREHAADAQRAELAVAEARLTERLAEIEKARADVEALIGKADDERDARVDGLVKMIEANRPSGVAGLFGALDEGLAVEVLDKMNRKKAGKLLAALPPEQAARLAERMTAPVTLESP